MGWSSGSVLADSVYDEVRRFIPEAERPAVADIIYNLFCEHDADGWDGTSNLEKDAGKNYDEDDDEALN